MHCSDRHHRCVRRIDVCRPKQSPSLRNENKQETNLLDVASIVTLVCGMTEPVIRSEKRLIIGGEIRPVARQRWRGRLAFYSIVSSVNAKGCFFCVFLFVFALLLSF